MTQRLTYVVKDWDANFENSQSRKYDSISWVPIPNKHDGKSFRRLMRMPDGARHYGIWILIVQVASKCPTRGILADSDGPLSAEDISLKCDAPEDEIAAAIEVLTAPAIGWLAVKVDDTGSTLPAEPQQTGSTLPADSDRTTLNRKKELINTPLPPNGGDELKVPESGKPEQKPKKSRRRSSSNGKPPRKLSKADLANTGKVLGWLEAHGRGLPKPLDPNHHETRIRVLASAMAAEKADDPGPYFAACMRHQRWDRLDDNDLHAAKRRLAAHDAPGIPPEADELVARWSSPIFDGLNESQGELAHVC